MLFSYARRKSQSHSRKHFTFNLKTNLEDDNVRAVSDIQKEFYYGFLTSCGKDSHLTMTAPDDLHVTYGEYKYYENPSDDVPVAIDVVHDRERALQDFNFIQYYMGDLSKLDISSIEGLKQSGLRVNEHGFILLEFEFNNHEGKTNPFNQVAFEFNRAGFQYEKHYEGRSPKLALSKFFRYSPHQDYPNIKIHVTIGKIRLSDFDVNLNENLKKHAKDLCEKMSACDPILINLPPKVILSGAYNERGNRNVIFQKTMRLNEGRPQVRELTFDTYAEVKDESLQIFTALSSVFSEHIYAFEPHVHFSVSFGKYKYSKVADKLSDEKMDLNRYFIYEGLNQSLPELIVNGIEINQDGLVSLVCAENDGGVNSFAHSFEKANEAKLHSANYSRSNGESTDDVKISIGFGMLKLKEERDNSGHEFVEAKLYNIDLRHRANSICKDVFEIFKRRHLKGPIQFQPRIIIGCENESGKRLTLNINEDLEASSSQFTSSFEKMKIEDSEKRRPKKQPQKSVGYELSSEKDFPSLRG